MANSKQVLEKLQKDKVIIPEELIDRAIDFCEFFERYREC